jgi:hypothetical protein
MQDVNRKLLILSDTYGGAHTKKRKVSRKAKNIKKASCNPKETNLPWWNNPLIVSGTIVLALILLGGVFLFFNQNDSERFQIITNSAKRFNTSTPIVYKLDKKTGDVWIIYRNGETKKCTFEEYLERVGRP